MKLLITITSTLLSVRALLFPRTIPTKNDRACHWKYGSGKVSSIVANMCWFEADSGWLVWIDVRSLTKTEKENKK